MFPERLSYGQAHLLAVRCQVGGIAPSAVTNTIRRRLPPHLTSVICRRAEQAPTTKLPDQTRSTNIATVKSPTTSAPTTTNTTSPADDETDTPAQPAITKNECLTILSLNILSLKPKILNLGHDLELLDCDTAVITETRLRPETSSRFITTRGPTLRNLLKGNFKGYCKAPTAKQQRQAQTANRQSSTRNHQPQTPKRKPPNANRQMQTAKRKPPNANRQTQTTKRKPRKPPTA